MEISVVIPAYNCQDTIINAINSVVNQTRYDLIKEIIIVNDGSKDNTETVIQKYLDENIDNKIIYINQKNSGAAVARNRGIEASNFEYIALLDSDDEWLPEKMEKQVEAMEKHDILAIGSNHVYGCCNHGTNVFDGIRKLSCEQYCYRNWPVTPSLVFSKKIFEENYNGKYFDGNLTHAEEGILFLKLAHVGQLHYLEDKLVLCGGGKPVFGFSGLSGNLKKMHEGIYKIHEFAYKNKFISFVSYVSLNAFEYFKYLRRIMIVKNRK